MTDATDLRTTALAMGDRLPAVVVMMAELRDDAAKRGDIARARFWSAQADFLAQVRDDYSASLRGMAQDIADSHVVIVETDR